MQTVETFLKQANFYPKLERWIFEKNICVAMRDAGFDVVRMKRAWHLGLMVVTGHSDVHREAKFVEGPVTRIQHELHQHGLCAENDQVDLTRQGRALTVVVGVQEPKPRRRRTPIGHG